MPADQALAELRNFCGGGDGVSFVHGAYCIGVGTGCQLAVFGVLFGKRFVFTRFATTNTIRSKTAQHAIRVRLLSADVEVIATPTFATEMDA